MPPAQKRPGHEALFTKLPSGRSAISSKEVASHQRARLLGAMVEASWRRGYAKTTLKELVTLAGVSNSAFYKHFSTKEDCFLMAFDEIVERVTEGVAEAYASKEHFRDRLTAAFDAYVDFATDDPAAAYLVVVDSLSLGAPGVERRQAALQTFEQAFRGSFDQVPERGEVSDATITAIVGGMQRFVFTSIRNKEIGHLRSLLSKLLEWGLSYQRPGGVGSLAEAGIVVKAPRARKPSPRIWAEPPNSLTSRSRLSQRERILRAVALVASESGYSSLSIPAITKAAGVSNQTFYQHFRNKEQAFMETLDVLAGIAGRGLLEAGEGPERPWTETAIARQRALLEFTAANPELSRLAFIEVLSAGTAGVAHVDMLISRLTVTIEAEEAPQSLRDSTPDYVVEAIAGGVYSVIQQKIAARETETLPKLLPDMAFITLAPFVLEPPPKPR